MRFSKFGRLIAALLLALGLSGFTAASGEGFVAYVRDQVALVSSDGQLLVAPGVYQRIEPLSMDGASTTRFAAYWTDETGVSRCVLLDDQGAAIEGGAYDDFYGLGENALAARQNGLYGIVDAQLQPVTPYQYTQIMPSGAGLYLALNTDPGDTRPDGVYRIDQTGRESPSGARILYGLGLFSEGLMPAFSAENQRMGYLNDQGEWAISPQFSYAGDFLGGCAEACIDSGSGLIDQNGNWLVTPKYRAVIAGGPKGELLIAQEDASLIRLIDRKTYEEVARFTGVDIYFSSYSDVDMAVLYLDDCTRVVDKTGKTLYECPVDTAFDVTPLTDNRLAVRNGVYGSAAVSLFDLDGHAVAGPYQDLWLLGDADGRTLFVAMAFDTVQDTAFAPDGGVLNEVPGTRTITLIDKDGQIVLPARAADYVNLIADDRLLFQTTDGAQLCDLSGALLLDLIPADESPIDTAETSPSPID